ncbi:hypothetical protein [Roseovarius sp.]|uniref:hypothetical protein n=1 Tax=Roseovarius sp. TaxID=1486281 RepID=UPI003A983794
MPLARMKPENWIAIKLLGYDVLAMPSKLLSLSGEPINEPVGGGLRSVRNEQRD